jgi:hypothetical protein
LAFDGLTGVGQETVDAASSGGQFEELVDELNLTPNISSADPPNLPLPHHVQPHNPEWFTAPAWNLAVKQVQELATWVFGL